MKGPAVWELFSKLHICLNKVNEKIHPEKNWREFWIAWNIGTFQNIQFLKISYLYRATLPFPASSQYELELKMGDVIIMNKIREDGWCKGTLQRSGQTGLFPLSFVEKIS